MNISHDHTGLGYTPGTPLEVIFGRNATAGLVQEAIIGPYFASGELMRQDITENMAGVPMHLDIQFLDVNTMKPVKDLYVDVWHCNALGIYSGVSAEGQGGLNTTWLRGFQVTGREGVVEYDTIVPGHYAGRAHHIHVLTTINSTMLPNHTYVAGVTNHIGQLFFEQSLLDEVETTKPYNENTQSLMKLAGDGIAAEVATAVDDPLFKYVRLSDDIKDGVLAYITVGIDLKANYSANYQPAAHWQEGGGVNFPGWVPSGLPPGGSLLPSATSSAAAGSS
jgi:protocatechuate 3,4-dioxygenase beta subunit